MGRTVFDFVATTASCPLHLSSGILDSTCSDTYCRVTKRGFWRFPGNHSLCTPLHHVER